MLNVIWYAVLQRKFFCAQSISSVRQFVVYNAGGACMHYIVAFVQADAEQELGGS